MWVSIVVMICSLAVFSSTNEASLADDAGYRGVPPTVRVGGLFDATSNDHERAFTYALERINLNNDVLPRTTLSAIFQNLKPRDSFQASKAVCSLLKHGVSMVVGPRSPSVVSVVSSTCNAFHVPHVETSWSTVGASGVGSEGRLYSLNVFPHPDVLSRAYLDLVLKKNRWKSVTVIYEDSESFVRMKEVLNTSFAIGAMVNLELFNPSIAVKTLLKRIDSAKEFNIVLDVATERVVEFLEAASEIGMMTEYYNYVITSLDTHTLDVSKFKNTLANVSALRLVDLEKWDMKRLLHDWTNSELRFGRKALELTALKTELALLFDAAMLFARALHDMEHIENFELKSFNCDIPANWTNGEALLQRMKTVQVKGLTGPLRLDDKGLRTDFSMNVIELKSSGFEKNPPYTMLKKDAHLRVGNDRFEGYCVDLMDALAKKIGFQYSLHLVKDGLYGSPTSSGEWNGMIRELIDREADMAIVDLTITYVREQAVDFTMPFMNTGISILFRKPLIGDAPLFSFLFPFSVDVWLYMLTAYLALSLWYCLLGRFSPMENKHTFGENCEPKDLDDIAEELGMTNRFWFAIGSLMQQGSDLNPSAVSTRIIASIWWFFTLIMISSYTANLAAFLTAQRLTSPIENVNDLAKQTKIDYGCLESGSTKTFFHDSDSALIKRMWAAMTAAQPSVFADSNLKGVERVLRGGYAYLMESTTIEYMVQKNCQLTQIGGLLDSKGYGIATPPDAKIRNVLSAAIVEFHEGDLLFKLKEKWWKTRNPPDPASLGKCQLYANASSSASNSEMSLSSVGGVFIVLFVGCLAGAVIGIGEFVWELQKIPYGERESIIAEMFHACKLVVTCRGRKFSPISPSLEASLDGDAALRSTPQSSTKS
ncbi:glutamate receptor ionotropic, kainate 2 isoform X2 [Ixodes scapularis]|uniref:glutamate receptor ionotropic, kainate 2 isoform X2 n=1 Tax=Ixodes scapularis TaxID=6945 RepID=UPI001A9E5258|nr:glutamate receptor ionotropic, kainate 2 isoform X2 [Ixodes scapularis]